MRVNLQNKKYTSYKRDCRRKPNLKQYFIAGKFLNNIPAAYVCLNKS
jgi:hypothetical protein